MKQKYYLKATGSTCYDETGITFPVKNDINFALLLGYYGATDIEWRQQFDWSNQPEVLTFNIDEFKNSLIAEIVEYGVGLIVRDIW